MLKLYVTPLGFLNEKYFIETKTYYLKQKADFG